MNSYLFHVQKGEFLKQLGEDWRNLPKETRDEYQARYEPLAEKYKQQMQAYKKGAR